MWWQSHTWPCTADVLYQVRFSAAAVTAFSPLLLVLNVLNSSLTISPGISYRYSVKVLILETFPPFLKTHRFGGDSKYLSRSGSSTLPGHWWRSGEGVCVESCARPLTVLGWVWRLAQSGFLHLVKVCWCYHVKADFGALNLFQCFIYDRGQS